MDKPCTSKLNHEQFVQAHAIWCIMKSKPVTVLAKSRALQNRARWTLPPPFSLVVTPFKPANSDKPLWERGEPVSMTIDKVLAFLALHIAHSCFPPGSGILPGDSRIFRQPPTRKADSTAAVRAVCLCMVNTQEEGLERAGRYRRLTLGTDAAGVKVSIYVHRWGGHPVTPALAEPLRCMI